MHVLPTWNESDVVKDGNNKVEVVVYSDAPVVKLLLNGEVVGVAKTTEVTTSAGYTYRTFSAGTMPDGKTNTFTAKSGHESLYATFMVPYAAGTLEVKAFEANGTTEITDTEGRSVVKSTSGASQLTLSADRNSIVADGDDLSYITIDVKDADNNLVNTDDVNVTLSIEGNGKIVGVDNGRQPDHTSYQSLSRNAAAGQLVAIVQSHRRRADHWQGDCDHHRGSPAGRRRELRGELPDFSLPLCEGGQQARTAPAGHRYL